MVPCLSGPQTCFLLGSPHCPVDFSHALLLCLHALPPMHFLYYSHREISESKCDQYPMLKIPSLFPIPFRLKSKQLSIAHRLFLLWPLLSAPASVQTLPIPPKHPYTPHSAQYVTERGVPKHRTLSLLLPVPTTPFPAPHGARLTPQPLRDHLRVSPRGLNSPRSPWSQLDVALIFARWTPSVTSPIKPFCDQVSAPVSPPQQSFSLHPLSPRSLSSFFSFLRLLEEHICIC